MSAFPGATESSADVSPCGRYRYRLTRRWAPGTTCLFVMLNPSTADATEDDPTIRRCIAFAKSTGAGALSVVNLFAWRTPRPDVLAAAATEHGYAAVVGPENDAAIKLAAQAATPIVVAWGSSIPRQNRARVGEVHCILRPFPTWSLGMTKNGNPRHPLYLGAASPMTIYRCDP